MDSINTNDEKVKGRYPQLPTRKHKEQDCTSNVDVAKKDDGEEAIKGPSLSLDQSIKKNNKRKVDVEDDVPSKKVKGNTSMPSPSMAAVASTSRRSSYIGVTYQSNQLKYEAQLSGEYNLGLFDLACDAAYMHDVAHRITGGGSSSKSKNLLIANDSYKIEYHCNWLEKERDAEEEAVGTADDEVNFLTPSQYNKARTLEMSSRMNDKVPDESELKIIIRREILNLAVAYVATAQKQREGERESDKKKVKSSLHKKKSWTPDIEEGDQSATVHPTPQQDDELEAVRRKQHNETKKMALANKLKRMMSGERDHQDTQERNHESLHQLLLYQLAARQQQQRLGSHGFPSSNNMNPSSLEQLLLLASARPNGIVNENVVRQMEQQQALRESIPWGYQHDMHINHLDNKVDDPDILKCRQLVNEAKRASLAQKLSVFQGNGNDGRQHATSAQARTEEDRAEDQATSECSALLLELARGGKATKEGNSNDKEQDSREQQGCDSTATKSSSLKSSEDDGDLDDNRLLKEGNGEALETTTPSLQQQLLLAARVQELQGVQRHAQTPQNVSTMNIQRLMQREMEDRSNQALEKYHSDLVLQAQSIIRDRQMGTQSTTEGIDNSFSAPDKHRHILNESLNRGQINQGALTPQALYRYEQIARLPYEQMAQLVGLAQAAYEQDKK